MRKLLIFTAPSGAGKTTIVRHLLQKFDELDFSVSATSRSARQGEMDGKDYYFLDPTEFRRKVKEGDFLEWEEVYEDQFYGTLRSEIERLWALGKCVVFDIEVKGATNIRNTYPEETCAVFVKPPSSEILFKRLRGRKTETEASLKKRIDRAAEELTYEKSFDEILLNDDLDLAFLEAEAIVRRHLNLGEE